MIKINYDTQTTLVKGYYPDSIKYASIPEPFIEIENEVQVLDKQMCVKDGVYQEYIKPDSQLLQEAKTAKIAEITPARDAFMYADIEYNGSTFTNSEVSGNNLTARLRKQPVTIKWLDSTGNRIDLTLLEAEELSDLIENKREVGYFQEAALITQINACTTIAEVEAINITF